MIELRSTRDFDDWLARLREATARSRIATRLRRRRRGLAGDVRPVGGGASELRIDYGPGYRLSFVRRGTAVILLLCGGDKGSQDRDIARAKLLAEEED